MKLHKQESSHRHWCYWNHKQSVNSYSFLAAWPLCSKTATTITFGVGRAPRRPKNKNESNYRKCRGLSTTKCTSFLANGAYFMKTRIKFTCASGKIWGQNNSYGKKILHVCNSMVLRISVRALEAVWPLHGRTKRLLFSINIALKWLWLFHYLTHTYG